jgi:tetratricopeptide (TPR) repeat protein
MGIGWIFALAILGMSFKVPSYAQTKAFYGLPALLPFCAAGALGFDYWAGRGRATRFITMAALGVWLINVYVSFWILPNAVRTELTCALSASVFAKADVTDVYSAILKEHPDDSETAVWVASNESKKNPERSVQLLEQALKNDPDNVQVESVLAWDLCLCHKYDEGIAHAKRAVALAPDDVVASQMWRALANYLANFPEVITASRDVLSLNPTDVQTRFDLGMALMKTGQSAEAIRHFTAVIKVKPGWAEAHFCRGLCLLDNPQTRPAGLADMKEAVRLDPSNQVWQTDLQKALKNQ